MKILMRVDGGKINEIGTGHIARTIFLANKIKKKFFLKNSNILFLTNKKNKYFFGYSNVIKSGYKIINKFDIKSNSKQEINYIINQKPDLVIFDRFKTSKKLIKCIKSNLIKVISFDDLGSGNKYVDLKYNILLRKENNIKKAIKGFNNLILTTNKLKINYIKKRIKNILIFFGGYDHNLILEKLLKNNSFFQKKYNYNFIITSNNSSYQNLVEKKKFLYTNHFNINLIKNPKNFEYILHNTDLAIISGGLTMFECLQSGIPSLVIPQYKHQEENIKILKKKKAVLFLPKKIINTFNFKNIINDNESSYLIRKKMSLNARLIINGKASKKIINDIYKLMKA